MAKCESNVSCNCTYPCDKRCKCCEYIAYHRKNGELPACYFNNKDEKTYNRSIEFYLKSRNLK
ncbi:MAG: hypothetical protein R2883_06035 [Caldisericia bacterium]